MKKKKKIRY